MALCVVVQLVTLIVALSFFDHSVVVLCLSSRMGTAVRFSNELLQNEYLRGVLI